MRVVYSRISTEIAATDMLVLDFWPLSINL